MAARTATAKTSIKLQSAENIGLLITKAIKSTNDAMRTVHEAAVQALLHAATHGDTGFCDRLLQEMPKSVYVGGLRAWFTEFSPIRWSNDAKGNPIFPAKILPKSGKNGEPSKMRADMNAKFPDAISDEVGPGFGVEAANATPFWELQVVVDNVAREPKKLDEKSLLDAINGFKAQLLKRIDRAVGQGLIKEGVDPDSLRSMVNETQVMAPRLVYVNPNPAPKANEGTTATDDNEGVTVEREAKSFTQGVAGRA